MMIGALSHFQNDIETSTSVSTSGNPIVAMIPLVVMLVVVASMWKIFTKAGKPGWAAIVPIYNIITLLEIVGRPMWWVALMMIPFVNLIVMFLVAIDLAKSFGKTAGFGIGLAMLGPVFFPMLGFGSAQYVGPAAAAGASRAAGAHA
jgi:hypothetical protein